MFAKLSAMRKALAAALAAALSVLSFTHNLPLPPHLAATVGTLIGVLTPLLTWLVPNKKLVPNKN